MTANNKSIFFRGRLILCDRVERGVLEVRDGRIAAKHAFDWPLSPDSVVIDSLDGWISPGFVDLHVHGGDGGDFMDGTPEAFRAALSAHLRHGTTRLAVTTTVARHEQIIRARTDSTVSSFAASHRFSRVGRTSTGHTFDTRLAERTPVQEFDLLFKKNLWNTFLFQMIW